MKQIHYKNLKTSSLGFGCASLADEISMKQAKQVLETAFDLGITHYDVARSYGYGRCEYILGKFLKGRREKVTVATKFGNQARELPVNHHIINALRRTMNSLPMLKAKARTAVSTRPPGSDRFSVEAAAKSLDASLRELNTDYIDVLLLHECSLQAANDADLLEFLERAVQAGKIRYYGLATAFPNLPPNCVEINTKHSIIQTENTPLGGYIQNNHSTQDRLFIGHSIFRDLGGIHRQLTHYAQDPTRADADIVRGMLNSGKTGLAGLLLLYARRLNPDGIVIFSSTDKGNIKANIDTWVSKHATPAEINTLEKMLA